MGRETDVTELLVRDLCKTIWEFPHTEPICLHCGLECNLYVDFFSDYCVMRTIFIWDQYSHLQISNS